MAVLAIAAVPFIYAHPHGRGMHGMHGGPGGPGELGPLGHLQRMKTELGLSDQQTDEIKAIFTALRDQNATYRDQLRDGHMAIFNTLLQNPSNVAAAQALVDQQTQAERALKSNMLTAASKALSVLTPEQRTKLASLIEEHKANAGRRGR